MSAWRYVGGPPLSIMKMRPARARRAMAIASILWTMEPQISAPWTAASWFPAPKVDATVSAAATG
jgi:hypothetical protein